MAYQLYPPSIPSSLPAIQMKTPSENAIQRKYIFQIPFTLNRSVGWSQITGFSVKVKPNNLSSISIPIAEIKSNTTAFEKAKKTGILEFTHSIAKSAQEQIYPEDYYKIQLAFIGQGGIEGYFSTVGYAKCVSIDDFTVKVNNVNNAGSIVHKNVYQITYNITPIINFEGKQLSNTELPYSYTYAILHEKQQGRNSFNQIKEDKWASLINQNLVVDYLSDENLHLADSAELVENINKTFDNFEYWVDLPSFLGQNETELFQSYLLLRIKTNNNAIIDLVFQLNNETNTVIPSTSYAYIKATSNYEDGFIELELSAPNKNYFSLDCTLLRAEADVYPRRWLKLGKFNLGQDEQKKDNNNKLIPLYYKDFLIEHGKTYIYQFRFNNFGNGHTRIVSSNEIMAQFEDSFLLDAGDRQLKIQYNPKISSFKQNILEQKIDTIGGKYPFFFRNGRMKYRDFAISGLISYQMDSNELFLKDEDLGLIKDFTYRKFTKRKESLTSGERAALASENAETGLGRRQSLDDRNVYAERIFKLTVQEWLGNGQVKILKTPTEGTFLVRLMNISFSPEDRLSRMLHNFSCQAYEIAPIDKESLYKFGFLSDRLGARGYNWMVSTLPSSVPKNTVDFEALPHFVSAGAQEYLIMDNGQWKRVQLASAENKYNKDN